VRFFRRVRYELYQAPDAQWYLGYRDCLRTTGCTDMTPVSGPYAPATGIAGEDGVRFAYYDSLGTALATSDPGNRVARVDIIMRAVTDRPVTRTGAGAGEIYRDSVVLSVAIRNRR
jgi:hypothetical protein